MAKYLIMCEGPNELEIINMLLENDKLILSRDDLLNLVPYHARQIKNNGILRNALNIYHGEVNIWRIGDKFNDELKIPSEYRNQIVSVKKFCTKPELEMLLIISFNLYDSFEKVKSGKKAQKAKEFAKENILVHNKRYDNSSSFYRDFYGANIDSLVASINKYKELKKHNKDEFYLADIIKK